MKNSSDSHDAVFIAMEEWSGVWRRSQNLAFAYARRFPECPVLFVETPIDLTFALRTGQLSCFQDAIHSFFRCKLRIPFDALPNLTIVRPVKLLPNSLWGGKWLNNVLTRWQVKRAMQRVKMSKPIFWINPYWGCHYLGKMDEGCVLYDVGDDWNAIAQSARATRWTRAEDNFLTECADAVVVVSDYLKQQKQKLRDDVFLIPNGIDSKRYANVWKRTLPPLPQTEKWKCPVLGYTGMLHGERLDIRLLEEIARSLPEMTIVLVGPNFLDAEDMAQLTALLNVVIVEPVKYDDVPRIMSAFDVCIVPNLANDFSESQNPLKLYEYLASGLPIVSTDIAGFRDYPDLVHIAKTSDDFVQGIRGALEEGTTKAERRQAAVDSETWDARLDALQGAIAYAKSRRANRA